MRISDWRSDVCSADLPYCLSALPNALVQPLAPISSTPSSLPLSMPSGRANHEAEKLCAKIVTMTTANPKDCRSRPPTKPKSASRTEHSPVPSNATTPPVGRHPMNTRHRHSPPEQLSTPTRNRREEEK